MQRTENLNSGRELFRELQATFLRAEQTGLRFAIISRTLALLATGLWLVFSRAADPVRVLEFTGLLALFGALGLIHYRMIGSRFDKPWLKYLFITIDITIVSVLVATQPLYDSADLPQVMIYRSTIFPFYFLALAVAAFSFSPGMVLWSGVAGALGWLLAFLHAASGPLPVLNWSDMPPAPTAEQVTAVVLDPTFGGGGSRIQEAVMLLIVAALMATVMWRARNTLRRMLVAERDRASISGLFGRFVPPAIVDAMIADRGVLAPIEREATVLFADLVGFTGMTERVGPTRTVEVLNAWFDEVTRIVGRHNGVITQYQGDAVLVTFNVPLLDPAHAQNALSAALEMLNSVRDCRFADEMIAIRIGINSGPLVAGNVGGGGRQSYTVHGDAVNLAARLEHLNKEYGTSLLLSASTATGVSSTDLRSMGEIEVRGLSQPVAIYTVAEPA